VTESVQGPERLAEPRGCPTPGACSCPGDALSRWAREWYEKALAGPEGTVTIASEDIALALHEQERALPDSEALKTPWPYSPAHITNALLDCINAAASAPDGLHESAQLDAVRVWFDENDTPWIPMDDELLALVRAINQAALGSAPRRAPEDG